MGDLIVYGAMWCSDCRRSKRLLDRLAVRYTWRDTELDKNALAEMLVVSEGRQSIPVIVLPDGERLTEASDAELTAALTRNGLVTADV